MKKLNINSKTIGISLVVFVIISIAVGIFLYMTDPKIKFMKLINNEYKSFVSIVDKISGSELANLSKDNTLTAEGNISFNLMLDDSMFGDSFGSLIDIINDFKINYQYGSDPINKKVYLNLDTSIGNNDLINLKLYQTGDKKYLYLDDIYDKYIESDSFSFINPQNNNAEDVEYLTNVLKKSLFQALSKSDFKQEKASIKLNDETIDTDKLTLVMTDKRLKEITESVLLAFRDDPKCIEILDSEDNGDVKQSIDETIKSLDKEALLAQNIIVNLYTKNNAFVKLEFIDGTDKTIEYAKYVAFYPTTQITLFENNNVFLTATFEDKKENGIAYKILSNNNSMALNGLFINTTENSNEDAKTWNTNTIFNASLVYEDNILFNIAINNEATTKIGGEVKTVDVSNAIKDSDLTVEDQDNIYAEIINKIMGALPTSITTNITETVDNNQKIY